MKKQGNRGDAIVKKMAGPRPGGRLGVAVSGGADSVALLHLLLRLPKKDLVVFHVDHVLRPESVQDALWVERLAGSLSLPFRVVALKSPSDRDLHEKGLEAWARTRRLAALARLAVEEKVKAVVMAHHAQDQVETFLWRLLRGSSLKGLSGIRHRRHLKIGNHRILFWRPLLPIHPDELKGFLREIGQDWREDASNRDPCFLRNRIRLELVPLLGSLREGSFNHIVKVVQEISGVQDFLQKKALEIPFSPQEFPPAPGVPRVVLAEALRQWWLKSVPEASDRFDRSLVTRLMDLLCQNKCGRRLEIAGKTILRTRRGLAFEPASDRLFSEPNDVVSAQLETDSSLEFGGKIFSLFSQPQGNELDGVWIESGLLPLHIRCRKPGDRFRPDSGGGEKKLARWLIDRKMPRHERQTLVVVVRDNQVLWIPGLARSLHVSMEYKPGFWFLSCQNSRKKGRFL